MLFQVNTLITFPYRSQAVAVVQAAYAAYPQSLNLRDDFVSNIPVQFYDHPSLLIARPVFLAGRGKSGFFQALTPQGPVQFFDWGVYFPATEVQLLFENTLPSVQIAHGLQLESVVNFYVGNNPTQWQKDAPTFQEIYYRELYRGIDLRYEGLMGQLKSTYMVAAGADPGLIQWRYKGVKEMKVDPETGDLWIRPDISQVGDGFFGQWMIERAPVAWQTAGKEQVPVEVGYEISKEGMVRFALGAYDPSLPLVIDPILTYSSFLGGTLADNAQAVAVDAQGYMYITGSTHSADFLNTPGTTGTEDVWVVKLNQAGSAALYITYLAGNNLEQANEIAVDGYGNVYLTGTTTSSNFPTLNAHQPTQVGGFDIFGVKLNGPGQMVYSTYLGTIYTDEAGGITVDSQGNAIIVGKVQGRAAIYKLDTHGEVKYGVLVGGDTYGESAATGVAANQAGEIYVTGWTSQKDFPLTGGAHQVECDGVVDEYRSCRGDIFLLKLNPADTIGDLDILYSTYYGGKGEDASEDIALGSNGQVYLTGKTISVNFPASTNAYARTCPSGNDPSNADQCLNYETFVVKLTADLAGVVYSTYYGGSYKDFALSIGTDTSGAAYITGWTEGNDLPLVDEIQGHGGGVCYTYYMYPRFCIDSFVAKFGPNGALEFSTFLGGANDDFTSDITVLGNGVYVVGNTLSTNYPTTTGSIQPAGPNPGKHGFITKLGQEGSNPPPPPPGGIELFMPFLRR